MFGLFGNPSRDKFAKLAISEAKRSGISSDFEYDAKAFTLRCGDKRTYLGNVYDHYCQAKGDHKERIISNFIALLQQEKAPVEKDEALSKLVAVVRERALFTLSSLYWQIDGGSGAIQAAIDPISEWFTKALVLDFPTHVAVVTEPDLARWGLSFDEAFDIGLDRLRDCTTPKFLQQDGYFVGTWNDDYDSSRFLLPELFQDLDFDGDPVVTIPNRLKLLVADSEDLKAVGAMLTKAEQIVQTEPRPQCPIPLIIRNGEVEDFSVDEDSPIFNEVARAKKISALTYYQQQTEQLVELYEKKQKDLHVAKYTLTQRDDGRYSSYSVWSRGMAAILPKTDVVMFYDPDKPEDQRLTATGDWEKIQSVMGDLMLDTKMFPPRFYVSRFPSKEQLQALGPG